jgi:uncharacterized protein YndB with AHSA1/START domain
LQISRQTEEIAMNTDRIERKIRIDAPVQRVWSVITEPQHVGVWFGQGEPSRIDLRPGGLMYIDHGQHGEFPARIEKVDPPHYFAYRWASAYPGEVADEGNSTLVEFFLEPDGDGTHLRLVESGFDAIVIPAERAATASFESHSRGWTEKVAQAAAYAENRAP